ncbi:MAG: ATP-binding cassette domain-containing protein [Oligoflexales bacterium]|nr:ATP-binding cassette domain-containing protein [Oligoflexales bacterium]
MTVKIEERKRYIFDNANLSIKMGKPIGLIGATGVGKSTLIQVLRSLRHVESGNIRVSEEGEWVDITTHGLNQDLFHVVESSGTLYVRSISLLFQNFDPNQLISVSQEFGIDKLTLMKKGRMKIFQ